MRSCQKASPAQGACSKQPPGGDRHRALPRRAGLAGRARGLGAPGGGGAAARSAQRRAGWQERSPARGGGSRQFRCAPRPGTRKRPPSAFGDRRPGHQGTPRRAQHGGRQRRWPWNGERQDEEPPERGGGGQEHHVAERGAHPGEGRESRPPAQQDGGPGSHVGALQDYLAEGGPQVLVEERQDDHHHLRRRCHHHPLHHPLCHRSHPHIVSSLLRVFSARPLRLPHRHLPL